MSDTSTVPPQGVTPAQVTSNMPASSELTPKQVTVTGFVDLLLKTYGPLGAFLGVSLYYIVTKDALIAEKDKQIAKQQDTIVVMATEQTKNLGEVARSIDKNTDSVQRLIAVMESAHR